MVTYHLQSSGSVRLHITINGTLFRKTLKLKVPNKSNWVNQRAVGKNSILLNAELERIDQELTIWYTENPIHNYTSEQIKLKIDRIVNQTKVVESEKTINQYFQDFINQKRIQISPITKKTISPKVIRYYQNAFRRFQEWNEIQLEQISEDTYNNFLSHLLQTDKINHAGKIISNLKSFFKWCEKKGYPINREWQLWKVVTEETDEEVRALNSNQLKRIYELKIDPLEIYVTAKKMGVNLDSRQVEQKAKTLEEVRKQAVAMCSIGAHKEAFWSLDHTNVNGNMIRYRRRKNNIKCTAPLIDNDIFHAKEFANLEGGKLFKRIPGINNYLRYLEILCEIPFRITCKTFRKTWGSIIWYELPDKGVNKLALIMKGYGHTKEITTRKYLGIQEDDLRKDYELLFS